MPTTPCGVLYQAISDTVGGRRYDEIDARIISQTFLDSKNRSPYDRISRASSFRTREIIQKNPRELDPRTFKDAYVASLDIVSYIKRFGLSNRDIVDLFSGDAADAMIESLRRYAFDYRVFRNAMHDITRNNDPNSTNTVTAVILLMTLTAFHGDPRRAVSLFFETLRTQGLFLRLETEILTENPSEESDRTHPQGMQTIGLVRLHHNGVVGKTIHELSRSHEGTVIGRTETSTYAITDVGPSVSRRHLHIEYSNGAWVARGLGSTNGSWVERNDGSRIVIEEPRHRQQKDAEAQPVKLLPNDILHLGADTLFRVIALDT